MASAKWPFGEMALAKWCRHCLSTNIIFGLTELSECRKCKRAITIDIINVDNNLKDLLIFTRIINIKWCMNCSEIIYFKQIITKLSFDTNYYNENQNKLVKFEKKCNLSERQRSQSNSEFELCLNYYLISYEWIESTLTGKTIPILYLPRWNDDNEQCIVCKHIISSEEPLFKKSDDNKKLGDYQKWCSNCFTTYTGCRYCLTTKYYIWTYKSISM
ncbi:hypothetical protein C1646_768749 [Rhizophagus diaphanus]|nr:hypothetical protein C1646_768749 [Rhizophagus diaphanus] [Rhizophagus sp. MUCL 43196]